MAWEWGRTRQEGTVTGEGGQCDGQAYGSLAKIAAVITGTEWNGPAVVSVKPRSV